MIRPIATLALALALLGMLACPLLAQESPVPEEVLVATEPTAAEEFTVWDGAELSEYEGTYSGEVGGDSLGKFTFKLLSKKAELPVYASGVYTLTPAGSEATVVKYDKAVYYGDPEGVFDASAFKIIFVKFGEVTGVIVGNVFLPKED